MTKSPVFMIDEFSLSLPPFFTGERIVCVNSFENTKKKRRKELKIKETFPLLHRTYTVREVIYFGPGAWGVRLNEIHNEIIPQVKMEACFEAKMFMSQKSRALQVNHTRGTFLPLLSSIN